MTKSDVSGSTCTICGKFKLDLDTIGTPDTLWVPNECMCATTDPFDYSEPPTVIKNIKEYLKLKQEPLPSDSKRLANKKKRKKRK